MGISRKCSPPDLRNRPSSWTGSRPRAKKGRRRRPRHVGRRTPWSPAPPARGRGRDHRGVTDDGHAPAAATEATNGRPLKKPSMISLCLFSHVFAVHAAARKRSTSTSTRRTRRRRRRRRRSTRSGRRGPARAQGRAAAAVTRRS